MEDNGCDLSLIGIKEYSWSNRGVIAKTDLKKGEYILIVPDRMIITYEVAEWTEMG